jgi:UPF0755 protein
VRRGAVAAILLVAACSAGAPEGEPVRVTIPRGAGLAAIADTLHARGVIASPGWFRVYATILRRDRAIRAGVYDLYPDRPVREVLATLVSGAAAYQRLAIPEGAMLTEIAGLIDRQLGIPAESVLAAARDSTLIAEVDPGAPTLEGYLYPSTYHVRVGADAHEVVRQMVREFEEQWQPAWDARLAALGFTRRQLVTLASIVEGEVRHDRDRRYVASVYENRLRAGWRLQADPTVIYALGRRRRLFEKDYQVRSPYNTYLVDGLPPGPIGAPSAASLRAALYPAQSDFFFLVARPDGQHIFSRTLAEHLVAVAQVRSRGGGAR